MICFSPFLARRKDIAAAAASAERGPLILPSCGQSLSVWAPNQGRVLDSMTSRQPCLWQGEKQPPRAMDDGSPELPLLCRLSWYFLFLLWHRSGASKNDIWKLVDKAMGGYKLKQHELSIVRRGNKTVAFASMGSIQRAQGLKDRLDGQSYQNRPLRVDYTV